MQMNLGTLFLVVSAVWVVSEIALVLFRRSGAGSTSHDSGSIVRLNAVIYSSVAIAISVGLFGIGMIPGTRLILASIGLALILLGLGLRWTAILTLRRFFTVNVAIQPGHRIVKKGLYGFIRHPSYLGSIVSFIGLGLALSNWIALALLIVPIILAFIRRIGVEEQALAQEFGSEYNDYCRTTWCLIPWLY
jgi:protein-S-isoprenylcysteine O-methyltransferase